MNTDFYELLGVGRNANEDEIKRAYRKLARELHPDANAGDRATEERFKEVTLAYETLRDPERRRRYDMYGIEGLRGSGGGGADDLFAGFGGGLGDIFEAFFGQAGFSGGRRGAVNLRGADLELIVDLEFQEAVFGAKHEVQVHAPSVCDTCDGSGARPGTTPTTCDQCGGSGEMRRVRQSILGQMVTSTPCTACAGTGEQIHSPCTDCRGDGRRTQERAYVVEVPAGVDDGTTLRLTGRGAAGPRGGPAGDLYVHLRVRPHPRFVRAGDDLVHELHLSMTQAALGTHLSFDTLDGTEDLVIPAGTQTGRQLRLRGRGVPSVRGRGRGDVVVHVVVDTPTDLSKEHEELLRRIAAERGEQVAPPDASLLSKIRSAFK